MNRMGIETDLLLKFVQRRATEEERQLIYQWVKEAPENRTHLDKLIWSYSACLKDGSASKWLLDDYKKITRRIRFRKRFDNWKMLAASIVGLIFVVGSVFSLYDYFSEDLITVVVHKGEKRELLLSDGTKILLAPDTRLVYPQVFEGNTRGVELFGEAFFDVAHNAEIPFVVKVPQGEVLVLGTKFNVKAYENDDEVSASLLEGKVNVHFFEERSDRVVGEQVLSPMQKAVFSKAKALLEVSVFDPYEDFAWQNNRYVFENATFREIVANLERLYDVSIVVGSADLLGRRFTGEFDGETIEEVLQMFTEWTNIQYIINDRTIYVNQLPM